MLRAERQTYLFGTSGREKVKVQENISRVYAAASRTRFIIADYTENHRSQSLV